MSPEDKLKKSGIELTEAPKPIGSYISCVQTGRLLFLSGILPLKNGILTRTGKVGEKGRLDRNKIIPGKQLPFPGKILLPKHMPIGKAEMNRHGCL